MKKYIIYIIIPFIIFQITCRGNHSISQKRIKFYSVYCNSILEVDTIGYQQCVDILYDNRNQLTTFVKSTIDTILIDKFELQRQRYIKNNLLIKHISQVLKNKEFMIGMTQFEFWLSLGDSTYYHKFHYKDEKGNKYLKLLENPQVPHGGKYIVFKNNFLYEYGII